MKMYSRRNRLAGHLRDPLPAIVSAVPPDYRRFVIRCASGLNKVIP